MDLQDAIDFCLSLKGTEETTPFGPEVLVYKVGGKMFATASLENDEGRMNLKCDPGRAVVLRDEHEAVSPGYHMNKRHWNTLAFDGTLSPGLVEELIGHSYELVVAGLTKKQRQELKEH